MCNELDRIVFCIWRIIDSHLQVSYKLFLYDQPLSNSLQGHPWWCYTDWPCTQDIRSSALVSVDCTSLSSRNLQTLFSGHGQHISITLTCLLVLSMVVASILLAFTWVVLANNGTSQKAVARSFSHSGLGVTCENRGSTLVMRSKDLKTAKNNILKAFFCLCRYLVYASALQPDRMCCTFSSRNSRIGGIFHQWLVILFFLL